MKAKSIRSRSERKHLIILERRKRDALSNNAPALAASYRELEASLAADANYPAATIEKMIAPNAFSARDRRAILSHALTRAARTSEEPERSAWELGDFVAYRARAGDPSMAAVGITAGIGEVIRAFGWGYQMLKGRRKHLRKYLDSYSSDAAAPRVIVNHLVDYDYWLGDRPRSDHIAQVRFYDRLARLALPTKLLTFAGFCPLRLAIERATPGVTPLFDQLKGLHAQGMIAGFKLYPPMGFKPIGNDELHNAEFDPRPPQRMTALDARYSVSAGALGPQLDTALRDLYKFAQDNSVPIMAHARQSNGAGPQYEGRADPRAWEEVANSYKLNIMLGHLIDGPDAFVGSAAGAPKDRSWPLDASIRLLKSNFPTGSEVLGDLGYMPEIIDNRALARDFFKRLKQDFGPDGVRRVCFGTDWIMLGRERDYEEYLEAVRIGMKDANYTDVEQAGILYANAMRYLRVSSV